MSPHICQPPYRHLGGMRKLYEQLQVYPSSTNGDEILIRSHIAYWSGTAAAERATIKPSRGHSYRVNGDTIVRIIDHYDHREGVTGWRDELRCRHGMFTTGAGACPQCGAACA